MTQALAIELLDTAYENELADFYESSYSPLLSATKAGEYLIDECGCDEDVAYEFSLAWTDYRDKLKPDRNQIGIWP